MAYAELENGISRSRIRKITSHALEAVILQEGRGGTGMAYAELENSISRSRT